MPAPLMLFRRFCRTFSLTFDFNFFILCHCVCFFSDEFVSAFSMVFVVGVTRTVVKSGMLFVLGVSESFKGVWGVTEESGVDSLLGLAKDTLLLNTWVVPYSVLV